MPKTKKIAARAASTPANAVSDDPRARVPVAAAPKPSNWANEAASPIVEISDAKIDKVCAAMLAAIYPFSGALSPRNRAYLRFYAESADEFGNVSVKKLIQLKRNPYHAKSNSATCCGTYSQMRRGGFVGPIVNRAFKLNPSGFAIGKPQSPLEAGRSRIPISESNEDRERIWRQQEVRANQGPFRDALIRRDGGKCAVTRWSMLEVIEAAHLVAFASGKPNRDRPENGVLLRADIHILFDRFLMAIHPVSRLLWVSPKLDGSQYAKWQKRPTKTGAAECNLRWHFDLTMRENNK